MNSLLHAADQIYAFYRRYWFWGLLIACLLLGGMAIQMFYQATSHFGIGVRSDSVAYLWAAENFAKGLGLGRLNGLGQWKPMTHWPPFYPMLLSIFEFGGSTALVGARWWGAVCVALILLLMGLTLARLTRSFWFSLAGVVILFYSAGLWNISLDAMTEPLFLVLGTAGVLALDVYLEKRARSWFIAAALCFGLSFLTRYAGIAYILVAALIILLRIGLQDRSHSRKNWLDGLKIALLFGFFACLPVLIWMTRNLILADSATNRYLNIIPIQPEYYTLLKATITRWIFPIKVALSIGVGKLTFIIPGLILFALGVLLRKRNSISPAPQARSLLTSTMPLFYALFLVIYPIFIFLSRLLLDSLITFYEERIIYPVYFSALILIIFAAWYLLEKFGWRYVWFGAALIVLYVSVSSTFVRMYEEPRFRVLDDSRVSGRSLSGYGYISRAINPIVRAFSPDQVFYTDNIEQLYFNTGKVAFQLNSLDDVTLKQITELHKTKKITFVMFYSFDRIAQIQSLTPHPQIIYSGVDGVILTMP